MKHDPGPLAALLVALAIGVMYSQGGIWQRIAALLILSVLLTPVDGNKSLLAGLLSYLNDLLSKGIHSGA